MYRLLSPQQIINNVVTLTMPYIMDKNNVDEIALKKAYQKYLKHIQPHCPNVNPDKLFYQDKETEDAFCDFFSNTETEFDVPLIKNILYPHAEERKNILEEKLTQLQTTDPVFVNLFKLLMNTVFCTVSQRRGGTAVNPNFIGVMCAYYDMNAEPLAIAELFIHEFTHTALFLDDLRYGHYNYSMLNNTDAYSKVDYKQHSIKIAFHRCLHSLIVRAEILLARDAFIGHTDKISQHQSSLEMIKLAKLYIQAVGSNPLTEQVMTPRSKELFQLCVDFFNSYKLSI